MIKILSFLKKNNRIGGADYYPWANFYLNNSSCIELINEPSDEPYIMLLGFDQVSNVVFDSRGNQKIISKEVTSPMLKEMLPVLIHNAEHHYQKAKSNLIKERLETFFNNYYKFFDAPLTD